MDLGAKALLECLDSVLQEKVQLQKQPKIKNRKMYKLADVLSGGIIHIEDKPENIYRLLRAMDYGLHRIFPMPKMMHKGQKVFVIGDELVNTDVAPNQRNTELLPYDDNKTLVLRYEYLQ